MQPGREIDEVAADLLLSRAVATAADELEPVVSFLADLRATTLAPPASPSRSLALILNDGIPLGATSDPALQPEAATRRSPSGWRRILVGAVAGLALTGGGVSVAAAAHLLPDGLNRVVASVVEALTPLDIDRGPARPPAGENAPGQSPGSGATTRATGSSTRPSGQGGGLSGAPVSPAPPGSPAGTQGPAAGPAGTTTPSATPAPGAGAPVANGGSGTTDAPVTQPSAPNLPSVEAPTPSSIPGVTLPPVSPPSSTTVPTTTPPTTLPRLPLP